MTEDIQTFRVEVVLTNRQTERQTERTDERTEQCTRGRRAYIRICEKYPKYRS